MTREVGLVVYEIAQDESAESVTEMSTAALSAVPPGRCIVFTYRTHPEWTTRIPYDAVLVDLLMGAPGRRVSAGFEFFANGVTRTYAGVTGKLRYVDSLNWVIFRRLGPKPYERRHTVSKDTLNTWELPSLHKVFTRDVANNVWHLRHRFSSQRTIRRLSALLAWPDEVVLQYSNSGFRRTAIRTLDLNDDLVGVAHRVHYPFKQSLGLVLL